MFGELERENKRQDKAKLVSFANGSNNQEKECYQVEKIIAKLVC